VITPEFDHVGLNVADLDHSIAFYQELFGFRLIERWDSPKQAFVGAGSAVLGLMEASDYNYRAQTMAHLAFPCAPGDFPAIVAKVDGLGLEIVAGPKAQRGGETVLFRDPSGNILEVCHPSLAAWKAARTQAAGTGQDPAGGDPNTRPA
jgi:catechol 2,3-dioxygenase-like lactoylglutathione lyase family enzyme